MTGAENGKNLKGNGNDEDENVILLLHGKYYKGIFLVCHAIAIIASSILSSPY